MGRPQWRREKEAVKLVTWSFLETTFWTGVGIALLTLLSPVILHFALRNEKITLNKIMYIMLVSLCDICLILWYLRHVETAGLTIPSLFKFYIEYIRTAPQ